MFRSLLKAGGMISVGWASITNAEVLVYRTESGVVALQIEGEINESVGREVLNAIRGSNETIILLRSDGGYIQPALEIGRRLRTSQSTAIIPDETICASACALIFLAADEQIILGNGLLGLHAVYEDTGGQPLVSSSGNAVVGAYLRDLGLTDRQISIVVGAGPTDMLWLDASAYATAFGRDTTPRTSSLLLEDEYRWIVTGSFSHADTAQQELQRLNELGFSGQISMSSADLYAVILGPFQEATAAERMRLLINDHLISNDAYLSSGRNLRPSQ